MNNATPRRSTAPSATLPQRKAAVLQAAPQRPPFRVLQTSRAPAQLSLYLRPGLAPR